MLGLGETLVPQVFIFIESSNGGICAFYKNEE